MISNKNVIIHPFLFGLFPIYFLYISNNVEFIEALWPMLITLSIIIILYLIFGLISNYGLGAIVITILSLIFFSYGHIINYLRVIQFDMYGHQAYHLHRYLLLTDFVIISILIYIIIKSPLVSKRLTKSFNIASVAIFIFPLTNSVIHTVNNLDQNISRDSSIIKSTSNNQVINSNLPDIYYIITDGHTNSKVLKNYFNYDNTLYTETMKGKGFYIASNSNANYAITGESIESSLNMKYLDAGAQGSADNTENNFVVKYLTNKNYKYYHFNSGWQGGTDLNAFATQEITCGRISEFQMMIVNSSALLILESLFGILRSESGFKILCQFDQLGKVSKFKGPKFIFSHIVSPHPPFIFDKDGGMLKRTNMTLVNWKPKSAYLGQLIFTQKKLISVVNTIINNSVIAPIIILQGDHGPFSNHRSGNIIYDNYTTVDNIRERMGIMNMYLVPDKCKSLLSESISPVNSFRVILNCIFEEQFQILENKHDFLGHDVTNIIMAN